MPILKIKQNGVWTDVNGGTYDTTIDASLSIAGAAADAKVVGQHVADKNNPHEVTAEQVGARPATWMPTADEVGARAIDWMPTVADIGAAPAGYGLGENAKRITNRNEIDSCGFWALSGQDSPLADYTWWGEVSSLEEKTMVFEVINVEGFKVRSVKRNYTWEEWEWINPPFDLGVRYKTTEHWSGKPVHKQLVALGAMPNSGSFGIATNIECTKYRVVDSQLILASGSGASVYDRTRTQDTLDYQFDSWSSGYYYVTGSTSADYSMYTGYILISYVEG